MFTSNGMETYTFTLDYCKTPKRRGFASEVLPVCRVLVWMEFDVQLGAFDTMCVYLCAGCIECL